MEFTRHGIYKFHRLKIHRMAENNNCMVYLHSSCKNVIGRAIMDFEYTSAWLMQSSTSMCCVFSVLVSGKNTKSFQSKHEIKNDDTFLAKKKQKCHVCHLQQLKRNSAELQYHRRMSCESVLVMSVCNLRENSRPTRRTVAITPAPRRTWTMHK